MPSPWNSTPTSLRASHINSRQAVLFPYSPSSRASAALSDKLTLDGHWRRDISWQERQDFAAAEPDFSEQLILDLK